MKSWKAVLLLAFVASIILWLPNAFQWTDFRRGLFNALFHGVIFYPFMCVFALIWVLLILAIVGKFRPGWRNWFSAMLPAILLLVTSTWTTQSPRNRFQAITSASLPDEIVDLYSTHEGGGLHDPRHIYSFATTPEKSRRLIKAMGFTTSEKFDENESYFKYYQPPGGFDNWINPVVYRREKEVGWYFDLITDESHEKVFIILISI